MSAAAPRRPTPRSAASYARLVAPTSATAYVSVVITLKNIPGQQTGTNGLGGAGDANEHPDLNVRMIQIAHRVSGERDAPERGGDGNCRRDHGQTSVLTRWVTGGGNCRFAQSDVAAGSPAGRAPDCSQRWKPCG